MQEERIREKTVAIQRNKDNIQAAKQRLKDINMKQQQKRTLLLVSQDMHACNACPFILLNMSHMAHICLPILCNGRDDDWISTRVSILCSISYHILSYHMLASHHCCS